MGTTLRISELSPVVANRTLPRAGFERGGVACFGSMTGSRAGGRRGEQHHEPDAAQATIAPRRTPVLLTGASIWAVAAAQTRAAAGCR